MNHPHEHGETVTVERPLGEDRNGDPLPGEPLSHQLHGCAVAPRAAGGDGTGSSEDNDRANTVIVGLTLYVPDADADLLPTDKVRVRGVRYEVEGEPGRWSNPFTGEAPGVQVALRRAT